MQSNAKTVDGYLAEIPDDRRQALETLRHLIRNIVPNVEEAMRYGMPVFLLGGEIFCAVASQKRYLALYCCNELVDVYRPQFGKLDCGKGCLRFCRLEDLPLETVALLLREVAEAHLRGKP